ncbi:MAG TPA: ATP-binding protein [Catalimonadaceae bacterium]|nr:ATP-binding protein [Catalimonadaceae bacterium]HPI12342.1 ATP-binding protein [Catalimonadaceae bacterium]
MRWFLVFICLISVLQAQSQISEINEGESEKLSISNANTLYQNGLKALKVKPETGIVMLKEAQFIFKNRKKVQEEVNCILALAEIHVRLSDYDVAYSLLTNASSIALDKNLPDQLSMSLVSLGRLSSYLGDYPRAKSFYMDANKLAEERGLYSQQLLANGYISYNNMYYLADYSDSNFVRVKELYDLVSKPPMDTLMMTVATNLMAGAYNLVKQNPDKAAFYYDQSIRLAEKTGDLYRVSLVSNNLAEMLMQAGRFNEAEKIMFSSLKVARQIDSKLLIYNCFRLLSICFESKRDYAAALRYFKSFGELKEEVLNENLIRKTQLSNSLYQLEKKAREAERITNEKALAEIESEKSIRTYQAISAFIFLSLLSLGFFAFVNRRQLQKFRKQNLIIEEQNKTLQSLNKDLIEQRVAAEKANKEAEMAIQSKIDFLSIMTHEIRTPINAVIGTVQLLQEENPPVHQHRSLNILKFSADNLINLVNDILDFNKIEAGKIELENKPFSLRKLLINIKNSLQFKADEKGLEMKLRLDKDLPDAFLGDKLRIGQVFYNLISNALKFTEKGFVEIEILYFPGEAGNNVFANIRDTGIGIDPEKQDTIFDFFSQAEPGISRKFGGSGLGLTITKNLLHLMNSRIELESKPNVGSCFSFGIHLMETNVSFLDETEFQDSGDKVDFSKYNLLFVEDVDFNRIVAERFLHKWKVQFDTANNSDEAVTLASRKEYDLILMDLHLPDRDGFETVRIIRSQALNHKTPVLAMTASGYYEIRDKLAAHQIEGFISKPFVAQDLRNSIAEWFGRKKSKSTVS